MNQNANKIIRYSISALLAVGLLYLSFREVDWHEFVNLLSSCNWMLVLLSMAVGLLSCLVRSLRWRQLLVSVEDRADPGVCFDAVCIGRLSSLVVPHVGEFVRCGVVSRRGYAYEKALGTVVIERAWDIFMIFAMLLLTVWTSRDRFGSFFSDKVFGPISERLSLRLVLALVLLCLVFVAAFVIMARRRNSNGLCGRLWGFVAGVFAGMKSVMAMKGKSWFILLTAALWACFVMTSWLTIKALPDDFGLGMADALFLMLVGAVAGMVPVPGGFGAFHYVIALALSTIYGIPWAMGIIFATLSHESQTLTTILSGSACLANEFFARPGKD